MTVRNSIAAFAHCCVCERFLTLGSFVEVRAQRRFICSECARKIAATGPRPAIGAHVTTRITVNAVGGPQTTPPRGVRP